MMKLVNLDLSNYELVWPTQLFIAEGQRILDYHNGQSWTDQATWLLTEALTGTTAVADFEALPRLSSPGDPWGWGSSPSGGSQRAMGQYEWFSELVGRAAELKQANSPTPYWPQRHGRVNLQAKSTPRDARRDFSRIIGEFSDSGYLAEVFGEECVDDYSELPDAAEMIEKRLRIPNLWPLNLEDVDEDTFYGLIEVFHDIVSRPRRRIFHSYSSCGWHHSEFHSGPARILYRHRINGMLRSSGIEPFPVSVRGGV
nr:hypothetical protein [Frankia casuarinae]